MQVGGHSTWYCLATTSQISRFPGTETRKSPPSFQNGSGGCSAQLEACWQMTDPIHWHKWRYNQWTPEQCSNRYQFTNEGSHSLPYPSLPATPTFKSGGHLGRALIDVAYLTPDLPLSTGTWISIKCCPSDHHFCILEIKWKALVGEDLFKIACPEAQCLNSQIPLAWSKYKRQLSQSVTAHRVLDKLHSIYKSCNHTLSPDQQIQMDNIDKVKQELMVNAEFHCQKWCMGKIDFLPDFQMAQSCQYCWSMVIHKHLGKKVSSWKIKILAQVVGIEKPLSITLWQAHKHWRVADDAYQILKETHPNPVTRLPPWLDMRSTSLRLTTETCKNFTLKWMLPQKLSMYKTHPQEAPGRQYTASGNGIWQ